MEYEDLLKRAYESLPEKKEAGERFEIPTAETLIQGNKTIIKNFEAIAGKLRREPKHLAKYLYGELAVYGTIEGSRLVLNTKVAERTVNEKLKDYVNTYVICKQCKKPDTKLVDKQTIICEACGARGSVPKI